MSVSFVGIFILPLLVLGIIGLILLLVKGPAVVRWIALFVGVILILGISMRFLRIHRVVETSPSHMNNSTALTSHSMTMIMKDPALWQPNLETEMIPDVYSGRQTAAFGLGMQLQETIKTATGGQFEKIIVTEQPGIDMGLLEKLRQGIQTAFPEFPVLINNPDARSTEGIVKVNLSIVNQADHDLVIPELHIANQIRMAQYVSMGNETGTLQAVVQVADGKFVKEVPYDYRAWIDQKYHFQTTGDSWQPMVFMSGNTAMVQDAAVGQVAEQIRQYILEQMGGQLIIPDGLTLESLRSHGVIIDEYTQKLQALSGPIWRAAMLVDVSPARLAPLKMQVITQQQHVMATWAYLVFSVVGMMALICLVYIVLNWMTKGYYSARLAVAAVFLVILLSGILLILNRAGFRLPFGS